MIKNNNSGRLAITAQVMCVTQKMSPLRSAAAAAAKIKLLLMESN